MYHIHIIIFICRLTGKYQKGRCVMQQYNIMNMLNNSDHIIIVLYTLKQKKTILVSNIYTIYIYHYTHWSTVFVNHHYC